MNSMVQKAQDRTEDHIRGIDEYFEVRRVTIGVKAAIVINEIRMNIPDEVLRNEHIETLISASTDMILIANDLYSYNVEFVCLIRRKYFFLNRYSGRLEATIVIT
jgi:hypothetical protein